MKRVFVDTGGFFALLVVDDAHHQQARRTFDRGDAERWQFVTTNAVVTETYALLLARSREGRSKAIAFLDGINDSGIRIERVRQKDELAAIALVRSHRDKDYSLCDAYSFIVMRRLRIREAISFDRHFREYGTISVP